MATFEESSDLDAIQKHLSEDFKVSDGFMGDFDFDASSVSGLWCIEPVMNQVPKQVADSPVLNSSAHENDQSVSTRKKQREKVKCRHQESVMKYMDHRLHGPDSRLLKEGCTTCI
ncbi:hypothetical protein Bca52824_021607 [Brassica carinata]|uniref:Uncharacterized protein n=1 Tax=Brassica carinata TaxID=52824 RepID=A0A8X7VFH8_BRACI|nr:hypothetical protein Bca52824_021607 [Brassica carinata]